MFMEFYIFVFLDIQTKKRLAFLDLIIEDSSFTEIEVREEVDTFLIAVNV